MAYCGNCGQQLGDGVATCPSCGAVQPGRAEPGPIASASQAGGPAAGAVPMRRTEGLAIASMVLGIVGIVACPLIGSVLALVFGYRAQERIRNDPMLEGEGLARAGVIMGWIGVGLAALGIVFWVAAIVLTAGSSISIN
jgi:hypothetical protein